MARKPSWTRRKALSGLAAVLPGALFMSGSAAAEGEASLSSDLTLKDNKVTVEGASSRKFTADDDLINVDVETRDELLDYTAAFLNQGIQKGHFAVSERQGQVVAESLVRNGGSDVTTQCGTSGLSWSVGATQASATLRMDDGTTEAVRLTLVGAGSVTSAVGLAISASGVGAVPGAITSILGVALLAVQDIIGIKNDGCGVKISHTKYYSPLRGPDTNISAQ